MSSSQPTKPITQNAFDAILPKAMSKKAQSVGVTKANTPWPTALILAMTAGGFIGLGFIFYIVVTTGTSELPFGITKLLGGVVFSLGLILVGICGGDLFTSSVLTVVAKASKKITWQQLFNNWTVVYLGNFIGAMLLVLLVLMAQQYWLANGAVGLNYLSTASNKLNYDFSQAVALGILCNFMVCLAVWMTFSARSVVDKVVVIVPPISMFVACGFEHCIANMFLIPLAIFIKDIAPAEFWLQIGFTANDFAHLTWSNFAIDNLIPVTLGNIIGGGLFVGLTYWLVYLREEPIGSSKA
ncbi:formate transporter FocA [Catenovulum sp. SM1970]|uniref:formate transporter FocA n=1 Tax=Marinifaba aquimaris TaxID=2741323 RepID=UPI001574220C|nr:formate transporter FocA [Marinifaba aquimaris]NTS77279.1 formate transporter FocA [Marinifaba aquimaris]